MVWREGTSQKDPEMTYRLTDAVCRLIAYRRVSTKKQGISGLGLEGQDMAIAVHAKTCGCTVVATYTEIETGKRSDRPELAKAMAHAKRIGATLVIAKLDRLSRNVHFLSGLMESGVDFVCCDMPTANRLTLHIMAAVAEDEARRISERTKTALAAAKARGVVLGGVRAGQRPLTAEERMSGSQKGGLKAATKIRKQAIDAYANLQPKMEGMRTGGMSLGAIAERLNEEGYTTRTEKPWNATQVMRVLNRAK